ncbi:hypothetical protein G7Y79_00032g067320 [Physcia stellaris]|nr:hypothetical protein G7Y79_00032g067320 [Physcia stellaris]
MDIGSIHLPLETLSLIFSHLKPKFYEREIRHLQNARLVCRSFNDAASPFLITKVWISTDVSEWERLRKIAGHPVFGRCVREIEYDGAYYETGFLSRRDYVDALGSASNPRTRGLTCACDGSAVTYTKAAVLRGYREYKRRFLHQAQLEKYSGDHMTDFFFTRHHPPGLTQMIEACDVDGLEAHLPGNLISLVRALRSMPRVNRLVFTGDVKRGSRHYWHHADLSYLREPECFSFTIENEGVRGQDKVIIDPRPWPDSQMEPLDKSSRNFGFHVLTQAASMVGISALTSFTATACGYGIRNGISHWAFRMSPTQLTHARNAFRNLTEIELQISTNEYEGYPQLQPNINSGNIALCLGAARGLKTLDLAFDAPYTEVPHLETILGKDLWSSLYDVSLKNFYVREKHLMLFLLRHKASLRKLCLDYMLLQHSDYASEEFHEPVTWKNAYRQMSELSLEPLTISSPFQDRYPVTIDMHWHSTDPAEINRLLLSGGDADYAEENSSEKFQ